MAIAAAHLVGERERERERYLQAGHAKKLAPIIASLDSYDHDPRTWQPLRQSVDEMTRGWEELIALVPDERDEQRSALARQRDRCYEALRVQSELFQTHRQTCVRALRLQTDGGGA